MITKIRHDWPEKAGFFISRPNGAKDYTFLHFITSVQINLGVKTVTTTPGACIFYKPSTPQWFYSENDMVHNWMHCTGELGDLLHEYKIPCDELLYPDNTSYISDIFYKLEAEHSSENQDKEKLMNSYLNEFLIMLSRSIHGNPTAEQIDRGLQAKMRSARQFVLSHPERDWTVAEMATIASLSASRFHAVYKTMFASSPMRDLISARIDYAKSLLLSDGEKSVSQIAEKSGYNDQYHFIRQFKAVIGKTPGAYRKNKR